MNLFLAHIIVAAILYVLFWLGDRPSITPELLMFYILCVSVIPPMLIRWYR